MEAGKEGLTWDSVREATRQEIASLKRESHDLKQLVADLSLEAHRLKWGPGYFNLITSLGHNFVGHPVGCDFADKPSDVPVTVAWTKKFMEAGKEGLTRDSVREATRQEIASLKRESHDLKQLVADLSLEAHRLKWGPGYFNLITSLGHNFVGHPVGCDFADKPSDVPVTVDVALDPKLGPLQNMCWHFKF